MSTSRVRIGFVGVGGMGQCAHLKNYAALPELCEVVALAELRQDLGRAVAARYAIPKVYGNHEELLASEKLDGVVASQPFSRHGVLVPELLRAGVPVFTEKPLAGSVAVGERIVEAVAASGTFLMVGYHKRSDPATQYGVEQIRELQHSGEIGAMTYVRILMPAGDWIAGGFNDLVRGGDPLPPLQWDPPAADMSTELFSEYTRFVNYYIHQVNLMRHLLGEDYVVKYADPTGRILVGQAAGGIPCSIEMSPYVTTIDWQEEALVAFERGFVRITLPAPLASNRPGSVEVFKDPGKGATPTRLIPQLPWVHAMRQQAMNFLAAIRGERPPPCDAATALKDLQTAREVIRLRYGV
jgi:predicted dehydrogenase